jgi:hypothetical protein
MTHGRKTLLCLVGGLSACTLTISAWGNTGDNPYKTIVDRNVFGLKPPPSPESLLPQEPKNPPPKITLTGITTILGNKRALMKTPPAAVKPGEQPREQSYILSEGQRDGELEVVQIDEKTGSVKLMYAGSPVTLTFEKDGPKNAPGGLPAPTGMVPGMPPGGGRPFPGTDGSIRALPTRTMRAGAPSAMVQPAAYQPGQGGYQPPANSSANPAALGSAAYQSGTLATSAGAGSALANSGVSLTSPVATQRIQPNWPPDMNLTPEEQIAYMHVQQEANKNNPNFPGFPGVGGSPQPAPQQQAQ